MTGKSNVRNYVDFGVLPRDEYLMIDLFREAGYATAIAGKWRQNRVVAIVEGVAGGAGFDTYCLWGTRNAGDNRYWNASPECDGQVTELETDEYAPDVFVNFLLEFIESNQDRPFFAYYPMVLSHPPFVAPPQSQCPGDDEQCIFEDMVAYMDGNVGRLHSKLAELELLDNTIVLFTSDNGTPHMMVSALNGETIHGTRPQLEMLARTYRCLSMSLERQQGEWSMTLSTSLTSCPRWLTRQSHCAKSRGA